MSAPYGQPPAAPPPGSGTSSGGGLDIGEIAAIVAAVLGFVVYLCSFAESARFASLEVYLLLGAGLLAAAALLPRSPDVLVPAAVLSTVGSLGVLASLVAAPEGTEVSGVVVVIVVLGLLQTVVLVVAVLLRAGAINIRPRQASAPAQQQQWGPQPGPRAGSGPGQPGQVPPGQYGQPAPGQYGQGQYPNPSGHTGPLSQPTQQQPLPGRYDQGPRQYGEETTQYRYPGERRGEGAPGAAGGSGAYDPGQYGQPGTPPGGGTGPDRG